MDRPEFPPVQSRMFLPRTCSSLSEGLGGPSLLAPLRYALEGTLMRLLLHIAISSYPAILCTDRDGYRKIDAASRSPVWGTRILQLCRPEARGEPCFVHGKDSMVFARPPRWISNIGFASTYFEGIQQRKPCGVVQWGEGDRGGICWTAHRRR